MHLRPDPSFDLLGAILLAELKRGITAPAIGAAAADDIRATAKPSLENYSRLRPIASAIDAGAPAP
jgi:hypothetical protein